VSSLRTRQNTWRHRSWCWYPYTSTTFRITNQGKTMSTILASENQHGSHWLSHYLFSDVCSNQSKSSIRWGNHNSSGFGTKFLLLTTWCTISSLE
jgi:hypothetical protein